MQPCSTILGIIEMRLRGISYDDCRRRYGVGNSTITLIMDRYTAHGVPLEDLKKLSATDVESTFYPPDNIRRKAEDVMPNYEAIYERIMRDGSKANLYFMWLKYKQEHPSGYQYTQFCHHYNQYLNAHHGSKALSMAVERVPGERIYIDWVGDQPELLVDPKTGELQKVHFFTTAVGVSSMVYAEAFLDEKLHSFIAGTVHALAYYGAVPKYLVPDNLKAAITKHTKDELLVMCTGQSKLLVEEAARLCVESNACRYSYFKRCLKQLSELPAGTEKQNLPEHENLRGKEAYK